jgi:F-type H+-transporting ATPase subunit delta
MSWIAARRYARALMDIGIDRGTYQQYVNELAEAHEMIQKVPTLKASLLNLSFSISSKRELLERIFKQSGLSKEVISFLSLLVERDRLPVLPLIIQHAQNMINEREGKVRAYVYSFLPINDRQMEELKESLQESVGKKVILENKVEKEILGGIVITINNILIDNSIRTQFSQIAEALRRSE